MKRSNLPKPSGEVNALKMSFEEWPFTSAWSLHGNREIVSRYEILERIGEGTFGEVHRARRREDDLIVALKEIHDFHSSDREMKALLLLDHPNVVKLHEYFAQGRNVVLVLEYLPHNLSEVIRASKGELSDAEVKGWAIQLLRGLAACHAASVLHRDLKPNNLLISEDRTLKIADFGQARILSEGDFENEGLSGSENHKSTTTGSEGQSVHDGPRMSDNQGLESQAGVSVEAGDVDSIEESLDGRWVGTSGEPMPSGDVCSSWTQTEGYNSTLSDAEGTRWYGAPKFQDSYMDSKIADPAGRKVTDETYGHTIGSEEEWEKDGSGVGAYQNSGAQLQESTERGNSESEHGSDFTTMVGTRWYKAPELLYGATKYGLGIDIWAVGCIFGELLWGKPLFTGLNDIDQLSRLVRILGSPNEKIWAGVSLLPDFDKICFVDDRSPLTLRKYLPQISEAALDFLQKLLTYDPVLRPTAEKALEDEFFSKTPLPCPRHELQLPTRGETEVSDEEWGDWKDPGSPFSDFEILG